LSLQQLHQMRSEGKINLHTRIKSNNKDWTTLSRFGAPVGFLCLVRPEWQSTDPQMLELMQTISSKFNIRLEEVNSRFSRRQLEIIIEVLEKLPEHYRSCTRIIRRDDMRRKSDGTPMTFMSSLAYADMDGSRSITFLDGSFSNVRVGHPYFQGFLPLKTMNSEEAFRHILVHEMAHSFQHAHPELVDEWVESFWKRSGIHYLNPASPPYPKSVSSYGNVNPLEDMAEAVAMYVEDPKRMMRLNKRRYEFVRDKIMNGREYR